MLVGDLRSFEKPANVQEAERLSRRVASAHARFGATEDTTMVGPASSWLDRAISLGLTSILIGVLFVAVVALAQAGGTGADRSLALVSGGGVAAK